MAYEIKKTEHSGPKKGSGAYWGPKKLAKKGSKKKRRAQSRKIIQNQVNE